MCGWAVKRFPGGPGKHRTAAGGAQERGRGKGERMSWQDSSFVRAPRVAKGQIPAQRENWRDALDDQEDMGGKKTVRSLPHL